ncbi:MAG TPA: thioesterase domain-containing protein [Blastocatellia bacterium]|jgi:medium-chain acyl-[acyl-carrier-protein] hydrolase
MNSSRTNRWIAYHRPSPNAKLRLFCFPYAGGGASVYKNWRNIMPQSIEVCPVQLPGREGRVSEPAFTRITSLVEALSEEILPLLDRPFAFFGHSLGGRICFEVARHLQRNYDLTPAHLFVSACSAPHLPNTEKSLHDLPHDKLVEKLRLLNGTSGRILDHPRILRMLLPAIRADFEIYDTYKYSPGPLDNCPITVFGGDCDPVVGPDHLRAWRELAMSDFNLRLFPGDHFFVHTALSFVIRVVSETLQNIADLEDSRAFFAHSLPVEQVVMDGELS